MAKTSASALRTSARARQLQWFGGSRAPCEYYRHVRCFEQIPASDAETQKGGIGDGSNQVTKSKR